MFERFARQARDAVRIAVDEAGRLGDRRVGTDHLLIGVLHDPDVAHELGAGPQDARHVIHELDRAALRQIGLDPGSFGSLAPGAGAARLPFTPGAKSVLERALAHTTAERSRRIESKHLLAALLERDEPDPAAQVLARLRSDGLGPERPASAQ